MIVISHEGEVIEREILSIVELRFGFRPNGFLRFSDQCSAQYKVS